MSKLFPRKSCRGDELPPWISFLTQRLSALADFKFFTPNHLHVNRYVKKLGHSVR